MSILVGVFIINFVDGAYNLGTYYRPEPEDKRTDGWKFQRDWDFSSLTCRLGAVAWHLWFGAHLLLPVPWNI